MTVLLFRPDGSISGTARRQASPARFQDFSNLHSLYQKRAFFQEAYSGAVSHIFRKRFPSNSGLYVSEAAFFISRLFVLETGFFIFQLYISEVAFFIFRLYVSEVLSLYPGFMLQGILSLYPDFMLQRQPSLYPSFMLWRARYTYLLTASPEHPTGRYIEIP